MQDKIKDLQTRSEEYTKAINRTGELINALNQYDKNTINKVFFEKYFFVLSENGEVKKDYKGNISTSFYFSTDPYNHEKRIYLNSNFYIDHIDNTSRLAVIEKTQNYIELLTKWRNEVEDKIKVYKAFNLEQFKADYKKLLKKHNALTINYDIINRITYID